MKKILIFTAIIMNNIGLSNIADEITYCEFKLPKYLYINAQNKTQNNFQDQISKFTNCNGQKIEEITETLKGINGKIPHNYLYKILIKKQVKLIPNNNFYVIETFTKALQDQIKKTNGYEITAIKHDIDQEVFFLNSPIKFLLNNKKMNGIITTNELNVSTHFCNFTYNYSFLKEVWKTKETLYPYSAVNLDSTVLYKSLENIWKTEEEQYLLPNEELQNFQAAKIIQKNMSLKTSDLKLKTVIQMGRITPVILETNGLQIKTSGISQGSGKVGETIEVKLKNNKIIRGTIFLGTEYYVKI